MSKRNLVIIHRGPEYAQDFDEFATKVNALDRQITVYHLPARLEADLPAGAWQYPTLTVSLDPEFRISIRRGPVLRNQPIQKLAQQELFRKNGIATPPALPFTFGMKLDPILFSDFVVLKTMDLNATSYGDAVFLFRRKRLETLTPQSLKADHPLRRFPGTFMVQRFIHTGPRPANIRVQTFLGKSIYSYETVLARTQPDLGAEDAVLEASVVAATAGDRTRALHNSPEALELAERTHRAMMHIPTLGIDIIKDHASGKLHVLEVNAGGNTWHFSSPIGRPSREHLGAQHRDSETASDAGRRVLKDQFGAFDTVARLLADAVTTLAR